MWRLILILLWLAATSVTAQSLRVMTWNLHDFPSGTYNLRNPSVEPINISNVAAVIRANSPDIILLQEVRDMDSCEQLIHAIATNEYQILTCSAFKDPAGIPTFQQLAIIAKLPSVTATWEKWASFGLADPPRGLAYAVLKAGEKRVAVYCLHLKSNVAWGADPERQQQLNILKRELSAEQLVRHVRTLRARIPEITSILVGGDLNTNIDDPLFSSECTLTTLTSNGFTSCFTDVPREKRITCPAKGAYPSATFDYLFMNGALLQRLPWIISSEFSDHYPVICDLILTSDK